MIVLDNVINKTQFERYLNDQGFPEEVLKTKQRANRRSEYGSWLRRTDAVQFNVLYNEHIRGEQK